MGPTDGDRGDRRGGWWVFHQCCPTPLSVDLQYLTQAMPIMKLKREIIKSRLFYVNKTMEILFTPVSLLEDLPDHDAVVSASAEFMGPASRTSRHVSIQQPSHINIALYMYCITHCITTHHLLTHHQLSKSFTHSVTMRALRKLQIHWLVSECRS